MHAAPNRAALAAWARLRTAAGVSEKAAQDETASSSDSAFMLASE